MSTCEQIILQLCSGTLPVLVANRVAEILERKALMNGAMLRAAITQLIPVVGFFFGSPQG